MISRFLALALACASLALGLAFPAAAQGLRVTPQIGLRQPASADAGPQQADYIVAVVNSEPITNNEVRRRMLRFEQQLAAQGQSLPPRSQLMREVLERLISEKAQLQVARETGIKVDDAVVNQAEETVARQNGISVAELERRVAADGLGVAQFRQDLRNQIMLQRLRDRDLQAKAKVSELEIDQYLSEQQGAAADPALTEMNLAHILVAVPDNATEAQVAQAKAKAEQLLQRVRAGEDFSKVARESSDAAGAAQNGGVIGLRTADRLPPLFVDAVRDLGPGQVTGVLRSSAGFHIVKVLEKRELGKTGITVTQSHARHILLRPDAQMTEAQARAKLADLKRRILAGQADFATLAREYSQDGSAANGGDLGWSSPGMFVPEFEEALDSLKPGQISDPVTTRFGVHLIQLLERRQATMSPSEQREVVRNLLHERKLDEAYAEWARQVRGRAYVEYRDPPQP
ncbi:MAG: peptidylprolyl isomerase [Burkholderiales bacterium]|nr:peptidylprolyl isomerase [Burkholderiales bacterium]